MTWILYAYLKKWQNKTFPRCEEFVKINKSVKCLQQNRETKSSQTVKTCIYSISYPFEKQHPDWQQNKTKKEEKINRKIQLLITKIVWNLLVHLLLHIKTIRIIGWTQAKQYTGRSLYWNEERWKKSGELHEISECELLAGFRSDVYCNCIYYLFICFFFQCRLQFFFSSVCQR